MSLDHLYHIFLSSNGVCTDTRKLKSNQLYIALKGENFNGNRFAKNAIENGAIAAVVDEKTYADKEKNIYYVENGLKFLQQLAHHHRLNLKIPIIALTGSNGKTTTKELIANCLAQKYHVAYTQGNLNNHIGVPLTLLQINTTHEIAVIEMGANHQGEIALLCDITAPDYGYITNFGKAHLEGFGGFEGVIKGKSEMYVYLKQKNKKAFIHLDDPIQKEQSAGLNRITFGFESKADYNFTRNRESAYAGITYQNLALISHLSGSYNENNIAAATTIALHFGVSIENIKKALAAYIPQINRSQEIAQSGYHILLDAYNANPSSMEAALVNFSHKNESKAVVLGDMFELGASSQQEHEAITHLASSLNFDEIYLIGENFYKTPNTPSIKTFKTREDFITHLKNYPINAHNILIKGSRGMALEKILDFI